MHPVGFGEHVVRQVQAPAFQNVDLDSLEHAEACRAWRSERSISAHWREEPRAVEPVRHADALRVVGDGDVLTGRGPGRPRPSLPAWPCRRSRVVCMCRSPRMSLELDQPRQVACSRPNRTPAALRESPAGRPAGRAPRTLRPRSRRRSTFPLRRTKHAVLVDLQPAVFGQAAEHDVVLLRPGEVLQRRAEGLRRHDAQVDLHSHARARTDILVSPRARTLHHAGQRGEAVHHLVGIR